MLSPIDAYELVKAHPLLAGTSPNDHANPDLPAVKHYYDLGEDKWGETSPPFIVWVPDSDRFSAGQPQQVRVTIRGKKRALECPERVEAGHSVNLLVARTADTSCYRELFQLLSRVRIAMRYALNTTANFDTRGGRHGGEASRRRWPNLLHYALSFAPYVPVVDEPTALAAITDTDVTQVTGTADPSDSE